MPPTFTFGPIKPYRGRLTVSGRPHAADYKSWQLDGRRSLGGTYGTPAHDLGGGLSMSAELTPEIATNGATRWHISMRIRLAAPFDTAQAVLFTFQTTYFDTTITSDDLAAMAREAMRDHLTALTAALEPKP